MINIEKRFVLIGDLYLLKSRPGLFHIDLRIKIPWQYKYILEKIGCIVIVIIMEFVLPLQEFGPKRILPLIGISTVK